MSTRTHPSPTAALPAFFDRWRRLRIRPHEGLLAATFVIVFLGFLATGRWLEHVVLERTLDEVVATTAHYLDSLVGLAMSDVDLSSLSEPDRIAEIGVVVTSISDPVSCLGQRRSRTVVSWNRPARNSRAGFFSASMLVTGRLRSKGGRHFPKRRRSIC